MRDRASLAQKYRLRAEELRTIAESMSQETDRRVLHQIAF